MTAQAGAETTGTETTGTENERRAHERGAAEMRASCIAFLQKAALNTKEISRTCRQETDRLMMATEANVILELSMFVFDLPLPPFEGPQEANP